MRKHAVAKQFALPVIAVVALSLLGCADGERRNTVTVSGVGVVRAQPDTIRMSVSLRHIAGTTREAQAQVTDMVRQALEILHAAGVEERNIGTAFLRFSPEYEWGPMGRNFLGQRAEQIISFSVDDIGTDGERASGIIDRLIGINGIELQGMHFSVGDPTDLQSRARELAYGEALEKARQLAGLSGQRIVRALHIAEEGTSPFPSQARWQRTAMAMDAPVAEAAGTVLPAGEIEISARISVEFLMR